MTDSPPLSRQFCRSLTLLLVRKIPGLKEEDVGGQGRRLSSEEPQDTNVLPNTNKSRSPHDMPMQARWGREVIETDSLATSAQERDEWSALRPGRFTPEGRLVTHPTGGWVGLWAGLDGHKKSRPHRLSNPGPSGSQRVVIPTELSPTPTGCIRDD